MGITNINKNYIIRIFKHGNDVFLRNSHEKQYITKNKKIKDYYIAKKNNFYKI